MVVATSSWKKGKDSPTNQEQCARGVELFLLNFAGLEKDMKLFAETVIPEFR